MKLTNTSGQRILLGIIASTAMVFTLAMPVFADAPGTNGTVKIHDGTTDDEPIVRNEPHVCTFHLHFFFGDDVQAGDWWIKSWPPTGNGTIVLSGSYDATGGEDRVPDDPGTFSLADGHYKLYWEGAENPGGQLEIKHKVFWVACEPTSSESEAPSQSQSQSESESASPSSSEGVLGGNPTPSGGEVPDTATGVFNTVPATVLSLVFLGAIATLLVARLARER